MTFILTCSLNPPKELNSFLKFWRNTKFKRKLKEEISKIKQKIQTLENELKQNLLMKLYQTMCSLFLFMSGPLNLLLLSLILKLQIMEDVDILFQQVKSLKTHQATI